MSLIEIDLPEPEELRKGWAAISAVYAAKGWSDDIYASTDEWLFHDGGGNWACLRFIDTDKAILIGHDHEYSETYFQKAATYFEEEETDLLKDAPSWWSTNLSPEPFGEWIGFIYGWDGKKWQRADYNKEDGFNSVGLIDACFNNPIEFIKTNSMDNAKIKKNPPSHAAIQAIVDADADIPRSLLKQVIPGWNLKKGSEAARRFLGIEEAPSFLNKILKKLS